TERAFYARSTATLRGSGRSGPLRSPWRDAPSRRTSRRTHAPALRPRAARTLRSRDSGARHDDGRSSRAPLLLYALPFSSSIRNSSGAQVIPKPQTLTGLDLAAGPYFQLSPGRAPESSCEVRRID